MRPNPLSQDPLFHYFFGEPQPEISRSLGSGVILSKQGYILTNNHVVAEADEIVVALRDGRSMAAQLVGTDPETDIAVLAVKAQDLPAITLGDSNTIRVGDVALAIGNPFGVGQAVTMGIISATGRSELGITTFENFIQTDAAINPGNSGGALVNAYGQLLGINTAILSQSGGSQGVGFAIPIAVAKIILEQIISHGRAVRGWIGVGVQDLNPELAESLNLDAKEGALVTQVLNNSPAEQAGLQPGDVISHINGKQIDSSKDLINLVTGVVPGKRIELRGQRGREKVTLDIEVGERPQPRTPPPMRNR
jgi:Do/DeqQ family serine protease